MEWKKVKNPMRFCNFIVSKLNRSKDYNAITRYKTITISLVSVCGLFEHRL